MGKQIRFYMTIDDEREFMHYVRSTGDVVLISGVSLGPEPETWLYPYQLAGRQFGESCHLWNRTISPPPKIKFVPQQNYYHLDSLDSEVINIGRSKLTANELSMGRLHIEDRILLTDGHLHSKAKIFLQWYGELTHWIRKTYTKGPWGAFVGTRAAELAQAGIAFTGYSV